MTKIVLGSGFVILLLTMLFSKEQLLNLHIMIRRMKAKLKNLKNVALSLTAVVACNLISTVTFAQAGFEVDSTGGGSGGDITDVPLDNGTWMLIAAGAALGVYKLYKYNQMKSQVA